jgi:hypothetical protein
MFEVEFIDILFFFHNAKLAKQPAEKNKTATFCEIIAVTSLSLLFFFLLVCKGASHFKCLTLLLLCFVLLSGVKS